MFNRRPLIGIGIAVALFAVPSLPFGTKDNLDLMISVLILTALASSWNILAGFVGRINLGHVAFYGLGALTTRQLWLVHEVNFVIAFILGGVVAALAAVIVSVPALRLKGIYFSVGTLAMAEALRLTVGNVLPKVSRLPGPELRGYDITPRYYLILGVVIVIVATVYWLRNSKLGLGMMAVREDEEAARSIGINVLQHTVIALVMSAFFAGLAGGAFAFFHVSYYPSFTFVPIWTFDALLVTFIGGIGTIRGPITGAVFFVVFRDILASNLVNFHLIIFGIVFIIVVLVLPGGIEDLIARVTSKFQQSTGSSDKIKAESNT